MKFKKEELLDILYTVKPALAKKAIIEQATHFIFTGYDICTFNDQISISCPLETDFKCSVLADKFYEVINKMDSDVITIEQNDSELIIKGKKIKSGLAMSTEDEVIKILDDMDFPDDKDWKKLPADFNEGINICSFSISNDVSHPYLSCLLVNGENLISSDDSRISMYKMKNKIKDTFFIPGAAIKALIDFEIIEYHLGESWVYFATKDDVIFCSRIIQHDEGQKKMLDSKKYFDFESVEITLPNELTKSVETSEILAHGEFDIDKQIDIVIKDDTITCRGEKEDIGWIEVEEKIKDFKADKEINMKINPIFLSQILSKSGAMKVGEDRALFTSDRFNHLISLIVEQ